MKKNWMKWIAFLVATMSIFLIGSSVFADDDHEEDDDDEKSEYYQEDEDDNDDEQDEKWDDKQQSQFNSQQQHEYWNIWSREARNNPNNPLPITEPSEITVMVLETKYSIYIIPQNGQLLVSGQVIANVLGAESKYYPQSKITILKKESLELTVKAGSNAVFENGVKNPMPIPAAAYENSVYLPISVAANALGYRVSWDVFEKVLIIQSI